MSDSDHKFDDELISAFLDGELTDAERARVERALSEDANCRRTWNELQVLRENLQSLPMYEIDPDIQDRWLRYFDTLT